MRPPKPNEFSEKFQRGGGSFPIQKVILPTSLHIEDIFDIKIVPKRADVDVSPKNEQNDFPTLRLSGVTSLSSASASASDAMKERN